MEHVLNSSRNSLTVPASNFFLHVISIFFGVIPKYLKYVTHSKAIVLKLCCNFVLHYFDKKLKYA